MTREEAIYRLNALSMMCEYKDAYGDCVDTEPYDTAVEMAIEALKEQKMGRWIPVSERLPKDAEKEDGVPNPNVLFCTSKKVFMGYYSHGAKCWWTLDGYNICEVIAWMPLPTPFLEPTCEQKGED